MASARWNGPRRSSTPASTAPVDATPLARKFPMASDPWRSLDAELDLWAAQGRIARLWLRDDDAVEPSPALDRLLAVCNGHGVPLLLAIIPAGAGLALAQRLAGEANVLPCQHG